MSNQRPRRAASKKADAQAVEPAATPTPPGSGLLPELRELILTTRQNVAYEVHAAMTMLKERTALSRKPADLIRQELAALREADRLTPDLVFKDPYFLDFLGLRDTYSERDLETAILREIERFLLELEKTGIRVAEYLTELPPREVLQRRLHEAVAQARARLEQREPDGD
jgi:hypothetical protein